MPKRKGRGLDRSLVSIVEAKRRLTSARGKMNQDLTYEQYQDTAETLRLAAEYLLTRARTPKEKLEYTRDIFQLGKFYLWKKWQIARLDTQQSSDYMIGKAMQAEEDQWKYINIIRGQQKPIRDALDRLGIIRPRRSNGLKLSVRIKPDTRSRQLKEYAAAKKRTVIARIKLEKYAKLVKAKEARYKANESRNRFEEWKNSHKAWKGATRELQEAEADEPRKKLAWLESKGPAAKRFNINK
jgi:hypothetical protein